MPGLKNIHLPPQDLVEMPYEPIAYWDLRPSTEVGRRAFGLCADDHELEGSRHQVGPGTPGACYPTATKLFRLFT